LQIKLVRSLHRLAGWILDRADTIEARLPEPPDYHTP
jgi:hypothetical protein